MILDVDQDSAWASLSGKINIKSIWKPIKRIDMKRQLVAYTAAIIAGILSAVICRLININSEVGFIIGFSTAYSNVLFSYKNK